MKVEKIIDEHRPRLLLFFCGWSASPLLFRHIAIEDDSDVWIVYDYRDWNFPADISPYKEVRTIAWSLGVWVATYLCATWENVRWGTRIAINGTPLPIDDKEGIPKAIFKGTLEHLSAEGMLRFVRRMCGSREVLSIYESVPPRPLEVIREELQWLYTEICAYKEEKGCFTWTKAWISTADRIFPFENQRNAWKSLGVEWREIDAPHYCFHKTKQWAEWEMK